MNNYYFLLNERLGIKLPILTMSWEQYDETSQQSILAEWENIRGTIPDRIRELEVDINHKQEQLNNEDEFTLSCKLNYEIAELASIINDLWLWYRTQEQVTEKVHM